jgi:PadR family transcriptional regulator, regulatory protein PadR
MPRRRPAPASAPSEEPATPSAGGEDPPSAPSAPDAPPTGWSPRDILVPYVLLAVSLQRAHGYLIEDYLRRAGFFNIEMSTLYRTLRQLEKDGLLRSIWEPGPTGPARRVYSLTDVGRTWLDSWADTLGMYRRMLDQFFGLYAGDAAGASNDARQHKEP